MERLDEMELAKALNLQEDDEHRQAIIQVLNDCIAVVREDIKSAEVIGSNNGTYYHLGGFNYLEGFRDTLLQHYAMAPAILDRAAGVEEDEEKPPEHGGKGSY